MEASVIVQLQRKENIFVGNRCILVQRVAEKAVIRAMVDMKFVDADGLSRINQEKEMPHLKNEQEYIGTVSDRPVIDFFLIFSCSIVAGLKKKACKILSFGWGISAGMFKGCEHCIGF
eukprot:TRINITY_DN4607_c1_g1_i3.p1 TRINITY_DN4607_c1_g1~~TRINITY_DN4607_c1_g1_i3.p1  ORF type:complete len:118 (+),score=14.22 TRINITY_DN4607_c1_g1_i3:866-1219(+)